MIDAAPGGDGNGSACNTTNMVTGTVDGITIGTLTKATWRPCTEYDGSYQPF
jgi:hypothetical protein